MKPTIVYICIAFLCGLLASYLPKVLAPIQHPPELQHVGTFKTAVFMESHPHPLLLPTIKNIHSILPADWTLQIFYSNDNIQVLLNDTDVQYMMARGRAILDPRFFNNGSIFQNASSYSQFITTPHAWEHFMGEHILIIQMGAIMCSKSPRNIDSFLKYDFIGAPWAEESFFSKGYQYIGSGGFTLRSKSRMIYITKKYEYDARKYEDVWFSELAYKEGFNFPLYEDAKQFGMGDVYSPQALSVYRPGFNKTITAEQEKAFREYCPEVALLDEHKERSKLRSYIETP